MGQNVFRKSDSRIFLSTMYLQNKSLKLISLFFFYVDTNSHKIKVDQKIWDGHYPKWVWSVCSQNFDIDCLSGMNR